MNAPFTRQSSRADRGFTLIELLVCIAILALMMAMTLPAIQGVRESARSAYCRSNLAQLGEAFHAYHMTHNSLPSGSVDSQSPADAGPDRFVWGWALQLLPQLGEQNRLARLDATHGVAHPSNSTLLEQIPQSLRCPSSSSQTPVGYAGCHHDVQAPIQSDNNGLLTLNSHVRFEELVDGLHQTILLGEAADTRWAEGTLGSLRNFGSGYGEVYILKYFRVDPTTAAGRLKQLQDRIREEQAAPPDSNVSDEDEGDFDESDTGDPDSGDMDESNESIPAENTRELSVEELAGQASATQQLNTQYRATGFWPIHRDSGHFLLADGSVRGVSKSVNLEVLRRLANRHDHQAVGEY